MCNDEITIVAKKRAALERVLDGHTHIHMQRRGRSDPVHWLLLGIARGDVHKVSFFRTFSSSIVPLDLMIRMPE